ncbi:MAG TPA: F0F1 ATP synthase subunit gamma [Bryobacteraceae bacterium]|nr:F0F1 ATP synthase subunit gamma [Bryobacteraceae bacterium]
MENSESLRRSIAVTEELQSVVKTMKALAGVNIRQYERAARAVAEYNRTVEMGLQIALQRLPSHALPPKYAPGSKLGAIVFGSDQGMCGQLNDQVVSHASRALEKLAVRRESQVTLAVGIRAASQLESLGRKVEGSVQVPGSVPGITAGVEEVLHTIEEWHFNRGVELVVLFYARPVSGAWYRIRGVRLLPVDSEWIHGLQARTWPSKVIPMFTMEETRLFRSLIREYLFVSLYRAFADSLASENASRLASMQVAERNIDDRLHTLTAESRQFRQASITSELLDIISSFEALRVKEKYKS